MNVAVTVITVPASDSELGADRMMVAGAFAVEERSTATGDVELRAVLGSSESESRQLLGELPSTWTLQIDLVDSAPLDTWRDHVAPIRIASDLVLRPAWLPELAEPGVTEVAIEPGSTFGLGDHPTTRLSTAAAWRCGGEARTVLDVGSGSGVLAIVALLAGAERAVAIDVAAASPAAVVANAGRNGVERRIEASTTPLERVDGVFDLVMANILAPALIALAADLARVTAPSGTLIVSGVLAGRHDHVLAALAPMEIVGTEELDGWAAVELRHPDRSAGATRG